jgi:hypothetical protein
MNKLLVVILFSIIFYGCITIDNRFFDLNRKVEYHSRLESLKIKYGEGTYYSFQAVDFSPTGDKKPSLERLKKLIYMTKPVPEACIKKMEIIDESRNLYEGGGETILVRCAGR